LTYQLKEGATGRALSAPRFANKAQRLASLNGELTPSTARTAADLLLEKDPCVSGKCIAGL
jgi:hypothetical protein